MAPQSQQDVPHLKSCSLCSTPRSVLVRCQIDTTGVWHFVCPATCWKQSSVAGGIVDGDGSNPHYRYGGMWKDKKNAVSAKKRKKKGGTRGQTHKDPVAWNAEEKKYTKNDVVSCAGKVWICRKSHVSCEADRPDQCEKCWKEADYDAPSDTNEDEEEVTNEQ